VKRLGACGRRARIGRRRGAAHLLLWAATLTLTFVAPARAGEKRAGEERTALAALPADIDLCVELRGLDPGEWSFLTSLAEPWAPLDASWRALASELELEEGRAFERLLGTRVTLAARGLWEDEISPSWAVMLETDEATSARLRKALKATPRRIVGGRVTLALKGGQFQIAEIEHGAEASVTVMLAPTGEKGSIFREACESGAAGSGGDGAGGSFARTEKARELRTFGAAHRASLTLPDGKGWMTLGTPGFGAQVEVTMRGRVESGCGEAPAFRPEAWEAAAEGALFWSVERVGDLEKTGSELPAPIVMIKPVIDSMGERAAEVAAVVLREREDEPGVIDLGAAVSAVGPRARAGAIDAALAGLLAGVSGEDAAALDFLGLYPASVRELPVGEGGGVRWRYLGEAGEPGWVTLSTAPELERALARTAREQRGAWRAELAAGGEARSWRTAGRAAPAAMVRALGPQAPAPLRRLSGIESIEWAVRDAPGGRVAGTFTVTRTASE